MTDMAKYPYLERCASSGIWQFRRVVPSRLRGIVGKSAITESLRSADLESALPRYFEIAAKTLQVLDGAAKKLAEGPLSTLDGVNPPRDVKASGQALAETIVREERERRSNITRRVLLDEPAFWRGEVVPLPRQFFRGNLIPPDLRPKSVQAALAIIYANQIADRIELLTATLASEDEHSLRLRYAKYLPDDCPTAMVRGLAQIEVDALRQFEVARSQVSPAILSPQRGEVSVEPRSRSPHADAGSTEDPLMSRAIEEWLDAHNGRVWDAEYAKLARTVLRDFVNIVGDRPISTYSRSDGREFRKLYERLPANPMKRLKVLGVAQRDLRAIVAAANQQGLPPQHPNTANQKFQIVGSCFKWLRSQYDACAANPMDGIQIPTKGPKASANEEKDPFSLSQLQAIFSAPIFRGCASEANWKSAGELVQRGSEKFWIPVLGLFTGARSNELCQLLDTNVRDHDGLAYLVFHKDMRLKTASSIRSVPIHPELVRIGFLEFVSERRGTGRLFPAIPMSSAGRYSDAFGKHFRRFLDALGVKTKRTDFHSFRHSFTSAARACGIDPETRERLIGHVYEGEGGRYGKNFTAESMDMQLLKFRASELAKLHYEGLDLSGLYVN